MKLQLDSEKIERDDLFTFEVFLVMLADQHVAKVTREIISDGD